MKLLVIIFSVLLSTPVFAGDCSGEKCVETDLNPTDTIDKKEKVTLDEVKPNILEVRIEGNTNPVTKIHNVDLEQIYRLTVRDRNNDGDLDITVQWIVEKTGIDKTRVMQNDGKSKFIDVTETEK